MSLVRFSVAPHETLVDAFYGGLLYLCHVVTSVSLDLFRVRWSVSGKLGSGGNPICVVREPDYEENRLVRTKTFSTHDEPKICHVVRKSGVFTHGKNSHEGFRCVKIVTLSFDAPGGGGASGGSLRSSRQAVACHPFTRSWATMPPETPPPPGFCCLVVLFLCGA